LKSKLLRDIFVPSDLFPPLILYLLAGHHRPPPPLTGTASKDSSMIERKRSAFFSQGTATTSPRLWPFPFFQGIDLPPFQEDNKITSPLSVYIPLHIFLCRQLFFFFYLFFLPFLSRKSVSLLEVLQKAQARPALRTVEIE